MVTAANEFRAAAPARPDAAHRGRPVEWALRVLVTAHAAAVFGQPVFAGIYMSGDYDGLRWHTLGADVATSLGYLQLIASIIVWVRLRRAWPFLASLALVLAETVQYFAGMEGALWLHFPLGVLTVAALIMLFVSVWRRPLRRWPAREQGRDGDE
ncbi:hypothetical protein ACIBF1_21210 [Spirillospora sp. NPDC050679]